MAGPADYPGPLSLLLLNDDLQRRILAKADYLTVVNFEGTCYEIAKKCENLFPELKADNVDIYTTEKKNWRVFYDEGNISHILTSETCINCSITVDDAILQDDLTLSDAQEIVARVAKHNLKAQNLNVHYKFNFKGLLQIIQALEVENIWIHHSLRDEGLLQLKLKRIEVYTNLFLTHRVINLLLQEWKSGLREIEHISLWRIYSFQPAKKAEEITEGLEAVPLWKRTIEKDRGYSITRPNDSKPIILTLSQSWIEIKKKAELKIPATIASSKRKSRF